MLHATNAHANHQPAGVEPATTACTALSPAARTRSYHGEVAQCAPPAGFLERRAKSTAFDKFSSELPQLALARTGHAVERDSRTAPNNR